MSEADMMAWLLFAAMRGADATLPAASEARANLAAEYADAMLTRFRERWTRNEETGEWTYNK